jgi:hypothetical protein
VVPWSDSLLVTTPAIRNTRPSQTVPPARELDQAHCHSYGPQLGVCPGVPAGLAPGARGVFPRRRRTAGQALDRALMLGG